jgi:Holliday junction resolvase RusA-like endonuclease
MSTFTITIPGKPIAKARPRFVRKGNFVDTYNCQETEEGRFLWECKRQLMAIGWLTPIEKGIPVELLLRFYFPIPKNEKRLLKRVQTGELVFHVKKPDLDNCIKFILDCFNDFVMSDDSQVVRISALKYYALEPRTGITVGTA